MTHHTLFIPDLPAVGESVTIRDDEAVHAIRVKRLRIGDRVRAFDGAGQVASARVVSARRELKLEIDSIDHFDRLEPTIDVWSPVPKGPRVSELVEHLSQVGVASWTPMRTSRSNVDPTKINAPRLARVAIESMKQCRRPWRLDLRTPATFDDAIHSETEGAAILIADLAGESHRGVGANRIRLLIGPEGGWTDDERDRARSAGATICSFGPNIMRIELAAAVAGAMVYHNEL